MLVRDLTAEMAAECGGPGPGRLLLTRTSLLRKRLALSVGGGARDG
jgi:hypothetical protein